MAVDDSSQALPFHEPTVVTILTQSSFILLLNIINHLLDSFTYCGLIGQVLLGVLWGTPLGGLLERAVETTIVQLGYIGLILLVYEGGLGTSLRPLISNLFLSIFVALTGICVPVALSFVLRPLTATTYLQCFVSGAALSATSLGTTFTILSSAGFANTRLGIVLTSAAMIDDVVGLVMVQVVTSLGGRGGKISAEAIGRPVGASVGLLVAVIVGGWGFKKAFAGQKLGVIMQGKEAKVVMQTLLLIASVVAASYAGASVLFAAFLTGAAVRWWDDVERPQGTAEGKNTWTGVDVFTRYYHPVNQRLLVPFFFASIGFSIPITQMFKGSTMWKGLVYTLLMFLGKFVTGIWLLPVPAASRARNTKKPEFTSSSPPQPMKKQSSQPSPATQGLAEQDAAMAEPVPKSPKSLYPSAILGLAMVARGEIAFLIISIAQAEGIFTSAKELYLIVVWAAMLCTIAGPIGMGWLVRRVKELEKKRVDAGGAGEGVLGAWGVGS
ncbi:Cation/H+ exchanger [Trichophaea hybrida]|nr:Cation/H+ exchanger [Trichophaea hybrida]